MARHPLEELIAREACAEILSLLQPDEFLIAVLRLHGLEDAQIGERLGIDRLSVSQRMIRAQQRIAAQRPDLGDLLAGRRMHPSLRQPDPRSQPTNPGGKDAEMETDSGRCRQTDRA